MKKLLVVIILAVLMLGVGTKKAQAQRPKLHIKAILGGHLNSYVYKRDTITRDFDYGWQGGFGFRVTIGKKFVEGDLMFLRQEFDYIDETVIESGYDENSVVRLNSFQLPVIFGYRPYKSKNGLFKLYTYGGVNLNFAIKGKVTLTRLIDDVEEEFKFKPKEIDLMPIVVAARMGVAFDIAMFNIDFNYNIGLNSGTKTPYRTQRHIVELNLGFVF